MGALAARGRRAAWAALFALFATLGPSAGAASAAAPVVGAVWVSSVQPTIARLNAEVDPKGKASTSRVDYIARAAYDANLSAGKDGFDGAVSSEAGVPGIAPTTISPLLFGLSPGTAYRYRFVVKNGDGSATSSPQAFATHPSGGTLLPDGRGWEMVSPVEKNGGQVEPPGVLAAGGVLQAAADGQSVTYGSDASFASGAQGAAPASQYLSSRGPGGWSTLNVTPVLLSGSYGAGPDGVPYQLFSGDLARGLLLGGRPCRGAQLGGCPVANPPLDGTDAPAGYQNYYLRENDTASFEALLGAGDVAGLEAGPTDFALGFAGASPDLRHVVLSTCAALTPEATEVPLGPGCDPAKANLYRWSAATGLVLVNLLPAASQGTPGAALAAQSGAVSADGARVYWNDLATGNLYLRAGGETKQVDAVAGGGGAFETATPDGSIALYTKAGHLYRYDALAGTSTDLTPSGDVLGVLGASDSASHVYYLTASGLFLRQGAVTRKVADGADAGNYPPTTGTARLSADGTHLAFVATAPLTGYDNKDQSTGNLDSQVYLYDAAGAGTLTCVSCNPTNARPIGPSAIPGAIANGTTLGSTHSYKPRVLSADGRRVFFDSRDALVLSDTNLDSDVYQWEAQGSGSCARAGSCVALISSGLADRAAFVDASADGSDAFFLTDRSLIGADPGSIDLYDARVGGGFPEPIEPIPCNGDACQIVPPAVEDPVLTTVLAGPGNPAEQYRRDRLPNKVQQCRRRAKTAQQRRKCAKGKATKRRAGAKHRGGRR